MEKRFGKRILQLFLGAVLVLGYPTVDLLAQDNTTVTRTPEELKELFGYCEKKDLVNRLKFSPELADKIGEVDYWAMLQLISVAANTNDAYATPNEVEEEKIKRYKALRLSADQLKALLDLKQERAASPVPCPAIALNFNPIFDTVTVPRAIQLYKTPYRKKLIDALAINGRQADMLFEAEVWKQKESLSISAIPITDFNRIRRTVAMYNERDKKYRALSLTDEQITAVIKFFTEHSLATK